MDEAWRHRHDDRARTVEGSKPAPNGVRLRGR
jgi:hypothetical protein